MLSSRCQHHNVVNITILVMQTIYTETGDDVDNLASRYKIMNQVDNRVTEAESICTEEETIMIETVFAELVT